MDMNAVGISAPSAVLRGRHDHMLGASSALANLPISRSRRMDDSPLFIPEDWKPTLEMTVAGATLELKLTGVSVALLQQAIETLRGLQLVYAAAEEL
jgi:hypothetical protein